VDRSGTVSYVSPNVILFGYAPEDFTSGRRTYAGIVDPADFARIDEESSDKARSGLESWTREYRILDAGGETHWVRDLTHPVRDEDGAVTAYEGYLIDVTAQKTAEAVLRKREEELRGLSLSDELTGLHNRRGLFALGEHTLRGARRRGLGLGVICVDVRELDAINQRFGHAQGDEALQVVAGALRASVRESDVVARVGGDEFVVLVEDGPGVTADVAARIRRRVERAGRDGRPYAVGVSLGATDRRPGDGAGLQELIERAQELRNDDKRAGRR
jgi:diguanylate cyclase (GGDEF)-like protein/PAS domain S-box-containing protein